MLVDINQIQIHRRVRKNLGDLEPLKDSLKRYGLLNPITITKDYRLIAGHRRLESARQLGWTTIDAVAKINQIETGATLEAGTKLLIVK